MDDGMSPPPHDETTMAKRYEMTELMSGERVVYEGSTQAEAVDAYLIDAGYGSERTGADWERACETTGLEPDDLVAKLRMVELPEQRAQE